MNLNEIVHSFGIKDYYSYLNSLKEKLKENNYKLYKYVPIQRILNGKHKEKANLLHVKQFGIDSFLNKYIYHNRPSYFNDPYDCVFGIGVNAMLRELLAQFTQIKGISNVLNLLEDKDIILSFKDIYDELDIMEVDTQVKTFVKFIFREVEDINLSEEDLDINNGINLFAKRMIANPTQYFNFISPFLKDKLDFEQLSKQMNEFYERLDKDNIDKLLINPNNPTLDSLKEVSILAGVLPESEKLDKTLNDVVNNFNKKIFDLIDTKFGVASLTTCFNNPLMWSHYASSHTGICIEYDFKKYVENIDEFKMFLFPVEYTTKRVTLDASILDKLDLKDIHTTRTSDLIKFFFQGLYTKHEVWEYENEWRSITLIDNPIIPNRKINFSDITAVYLGNKMDEATTRALLKLIEDDNQNNINVYKMINEISEYKMKEIKIK